MLVKICGITSEDYDVEIRRIICST